MQVYFGSDPAQLGLGGLDTPPGSPLPCGYGVRDPGLVSEPAPAWSTCTTKILGDGSKLGTASAQFGPGTLTVAFREFPHSRGGIAIYATDYPSGRCIVRSGTRPGTHTDRRCRIALGEVAKPVMELGFQIGAGTDDGPQPARTPRRPRPPRHRPHRRSGARPQVPGAGRMMSRGNRMGVPYRRCALPGDVVINVRSATSRRCARRAGWRRRRRRTG